MAEMSERFKLNDVEMFLPACRRHSPAAFAGGGGDSSPGDVNPHEPTSGVDPVAEGYVLAVDGRFLRQDKVTIFISTQFMNEVNVATASH